MVNNQKNNQRSAFTIVELLVVIVVIGILAAITIISYSGVINRAIAIGIQSDLTNNKKKLEMYKVIHDSYPYSLDSNGCPDDPEVDDTYCLKTSNGNILSYSGGYEAYDLIITHDKNNNGAANNGELSYRTNETGEIAIVDDGTGSTTYIVALNSGTDEYGNSIIQTSDGGYAIAGRLYNSAGSFLAKYDANGNVQWSKNWGGASWDDGRSLIQTTDGGYIVTGQTENFGAGNGDVFIAKYSSVGSLVWSKTWGGSGYESGNSIINTSDGGFAITGSTESFGAGYRDMFIAKYSSAGDLAWSKTWGDSDRDEGTSLIQTSDGGYAVTGQTESYGVGSSDAFVAKYSSVGDLVWSATWGGTEEEYGGSIIQNTDDSYIVVGATRSYGAGYDDMFVAKYSSIGNLAWSKTWGGIDHERVKSIVSTDDDGFAVTGETWSYGAGGEGVFISKYNSNGDATWTNTIDQDGTEEGNSIVRTDDGGYAVTGYIYRNDTAIDAFLAKFSRSGWITGCPASICKYVNVDASSVAAQATSPTATVSSPTVTETSPSVSDNSLSVTEITIWKP